MRARSKKILAALSISAVAVFGLDAYTYAGTGDSLILGKLNKSKQTTHVTNTGEGPALSLHAKGNRPALAVDSKAMIVRLNADRLDSKHASALQNNVRVFTATEGTAPSGVMTLDLPSFPKGRYQVGYEVHMAGTAGTPDDPTNASCNLNEVGGGFAAYTSVTVQRAVGLTASGVLVNDGAPWRLVCDAYQTSGGADDWSISPLQPIRVTLTRIDKTIGGKLVD